MAERLPLDEFFPLKGSWQIVGGRKSNGQSISGIQQSSELSGGGFWRVKYEFAFGEQSERRRWRAYGGRLKNGSVAFEVPWLLGDKLDTPESVMQSVSFSDGSTFSDGTVFTTAGFGATVNADAALRATNITIDFAYDPDLDAGIPFSIEHSSGARLYSVDRIERISATQYAVDFSPPLREPVTAGQSVNFRDPRCLMVVANPGEWFAEVGPAGVLKPRVTFIEHFDPQAAS